MVRLRQKAVEKGLCSADRAARMSDREALNLIFLPGFSTATTVDAIAGRGIGMDVVRTNVMRLGGSIHLDSEVGRGTVFTMQMPLSATLKAGKPASLPLRVCTWK